jgi:transposase
VIVLSDSLRERIGKWETYPILKEGRSLVCLAGASVTKTDTLLGASRATVSKVMSAYMNHGRATLAKRNSGQKSTLTETDCCTLRRIV